MMHAALLLALTPQTTWFVDSSQAGPGTGTQADPYSRIDFGVDQPTTGDGDTFVIAGGVYPDEEIAYSFQNLTFEAASGAQPVIEGSDDASVFRVLDGRLRLNGLRLDGGSGTLLTINGTLQTRGGAIFASNTNVNLSNCSIANASATAGGAIYVRSFAGFQTLRLTNVQLESSNSALIRGGGVLSEGMEIRIADSVLNGNADFGAGGALYLEGGFDSLARISNTLLGGRAGSDGGAIFATDDLSIEMTDSVVRSAFTFDGMGGGLFLDLVSLAAEDCLFESNLATDGGAIFANAIEPSLELTRCTFRNNDAQGPGQSRGGAIHAVAGGVALQCIFRNNETRSNDIGIGGATYGRLRHERCTFDFNSAGLEGGAVSALPAQGMLTAGTVRGCIVMNPFSATIPALSPGTDAEFNLSDAPIPGLGNQVGEPAFWSAAGEYFLRPPSEARDFLPATFGLDPDGSRMEAGARPFDPVYCGFPCEGALGTVDCVAQPNSTGASSAITGLGSRVSAFNLVVLNVTSLPSGAIGYFIGSRAPDFVPGAGGSSGNLCVGGNVQRFNSTILQPAPAGDAVSYQPDILNLPAGGPIAPGDVFLFQFWHRDVALGGPTSNFSPALRVRF